MTVVPSEVIIRDGRPYDAGALARLANALSVHEGLGATVFSETGVRRDFFAADGRLSCILAETRSDEVVGYLLYQDLYNTDRAAWGLFMLDLYIDNSRRGQGLGRALVARLSTKALERKAVSIWWGVMSANEGARRFYRFLDAKDDDARILGIEGEALKRLSAEDT